jgi:hypothetical protein
MEQTEIVTEWEESLTTAAGQYLYQAVPLLWQFIFAIVISSDVCNPYFSTPCTDITERGRGCTNARNHWRDTPILWPIIRVVDRIPAIVITAWNHVCVWVLRIHHAGTRLWCGHRYVHLSGGGEGCEMAGRTCWAGRKRSRNLALFRTMTDKSR